MNFFVGGMVGLERTVTPLVGAEQFHLGEITIAAFVVVFGFTKAITNAVGGAIVGRYTRKAAVLWPPGSSACPCRSCSPTVRAGAG